MATLAPASRRPAIGLFERYLSLWVALCIVVGVALGHALPNVFAPSPRRNWRAST